MTKNTLPIVASTQRQQSAEGFDIPKTQIKRGHQEQRILNTELKDLNSRVQTVARDSCSALGTNTSGFWVNNKTSLWKSFGYDELSGATIKGRLVAYGDVRDSYSPHFPTRVELQTVLTRNNENLSSEMCVASFQCHELGANSSLLLLPPDDINCRNGQPMVSITTANQAHMLPIAGALVDRIQSVFLA